MKGIVITRAVAEQIAAAIDRGVAALRHEYANSQFPELSATEERELIINMLTTECTNCGGDGVMHFGTICPRCKGFGHREDLSIINYPGLDTTRFIER